MDIDKNNFEACLSKIKYEIDQCDFLSIDTELTGLHSKNTNFFDTAEFRYKHLKDYSMEYAVTQFGICLYRYNTKNARVDYAPFNFHLLAFDKSERGDFTVNINTIHFLNKYNFNFNNSWREGVSYIRYSEYEELKENNTLKKDHELSLLTKEMNNDDFMSLEPLITECRAFLLSDDKEKEILNISLTKYEMYLVKERLAYKIGCVNGRWIFPILEYNTELKKKVLKCTKCENYNDYRKDYIQEYYNKQGEVICSRLKFSEIIKYISESKKLIVGHNCLLDCLHMYDKFIGPLPESYSDFKKKFNIHFPNVIDTKYMINKTNHVVFKDLTNNNLEGFHKASSTLSNIPRYGAAAEEYNFVEGTLYHTAHYDAFITGVLFLNILTGIVSLKTDLLKSFRRDAPSALSEYKNKFNLISSDISFINVDPLSNETSVLSKRIFHMTVPNYWNSLTVHVHIGECLQLSIKDVYNKVKIVWVNETSLWFKIDKSVDLSKVSFKNEFSTVVKYNKFYNYEKNKLKRNGKNTDEKMEEDGFTIVRDRKRSRDD